MTTEAWDQMDVAEVRIHVHSISVLCVKKLMRNTDYLANWKRKRDFYQYQQAQTN